MPLMANTWNHASNFTFCKIKIFPSLRLGHTRDSDVLLTLSSFMCINFCNVDFGTLTQTFPLVMQASLLFSPTRTEAPQAALPVILFFQTLFVLSLKAKLVVTFMSAVICTQRALIIITLTKYVLHTFFF